MDYLSPTLRHRGGGGGPILPPPLRWLLYLILLCHCVILFSINVALSYNEILFASAHPTSRSWAGEVCRQQTPNRTDLRADVRVRRFASIYIYIYVIREYCVFFHFYSRVLPMFDCLEKKIENVSLDIPLDKKSPLGLPRLDLVRFGVHWRFGLGVRRKGNGAFTGNHPCGANPASPWTRLEHCARVHAQKCAIILLFPDAKIPFRGELVWHQSTPLGGGPGPAQSGPRRKVLDTPVFFLSYDTFQSPFI